MIEVPSDSDEAANGAPAIGGSTGAPGADEPHVAGGDTGVPGAGSYPLASIGRAVWTAPESFAATGRRFFRRSRPWADLTVEDVRGSSDEAPEVDISDIVFARRGLDSLEEARRNFAATLQAEQRQFVASRDFLAQRRHEITVARDELS